MTQNSSSKIAIIGAGAAGLMCAIEAGKKGHNVHVFDHAKKPGEKIRISGGGRCNFTNRYCTDKNFISQNPHFSKSPLARYPASSFISMVERHKIPYHEKNPEKETGQLFCDGKSQEIIDMLLQECDAVKTQIHLETTIDSVTRNDTDFTLVIDGKNHRFDKLVIACGGPSIPKMGASDFGYKIARQFGLKIIPTEPALVPLTFTDEIKNLTKSLSGVSIDSVLIRTDSSKNHQEFRDDLLFTHRGLSGPAVLQISSYWNAGETLSINFLPDIDLLSTQKQIKKEKPKSKIAKILNAFLPSRFVETLFGRVLDENDKEKNIADFSDKKLSALAEHLQNWIIKPNGSEGYRTAEVTRGGVDTNELDNKTFESKKVKGLYFIGEVVDVTGHLGGHNFQWAWASGYCCGQEI
jgi:hypothetical protein